MGIGASIFLIAAGAVMRFAVTVNNTNGINIHTVGVILMVLGVVGLAMTALIFGPRSRHSIVQDNHGNRVETLTRDEL